MEMMIKETPWWMFLVWVLIASSLSRLVTVCILTGVPLPPRSANSKRAMKTLIVLGSGGHTAEILNVVTALNFHRYTPRYYVAASSDNHSILKAQRLEESVADADKAKYDQYEGPTYCHIYRSREVGQSYLTSVGTTSLAIIQAFWLVLRVRPDMILCNGPGTCLPICVAGLFLKILGVKWVVMIYIESIARVQRLSLTGLLFYRLRLIDQFIVQWPELQEEYPRTQYVGRLM